ncbi:uncharacterized protein LOC132303524 isoform X2 [Cornus florida]|uniref:uncharacterized protein LOC132303524 isoform X2 n=1 Tax=Cornus florida TaxID=4283 RepID=UPI0028A1F0F2|nr:uncharacterized protein LOC132303524 isoform X2 [Cornus florida]
MLQAKVNALNMKIKSLAKYWSLGSWDWECELNWELALDWKLGWDFGVGSEKAREARAQRNREIENFRPQISSLLKRLKIQIIKLDELEEIHPHNIDGYQMELLALVRQQRAEAAKKREEEKAAKEQKKVEARK